MAPADETEGGRPSEFALIEEVFAPLASGADGALMLKDDAALYRVEAGCETVLTVDAIVAGIHFLPDDPAESVARKLLRVNLSDLAAKGAVPKGYLLVTAWADDTAFDWIKRFAGGLADDQRRYGVSLWGGDTVKTPGPLTLSLTAIGEVPIGGMIPRSGARPGDDLYVTGTLGDAALGLEVLKGRLSGPGSEDAAYLVRRYREPEPRCSLGPRLRGLAHAALDVSDGLLADLGHICETSGVGARIEKGRLPLSVAAQRALQGDETLFPLIAGGGDDYEILFAASPEKRAGIEAAAGEASVLVTRIGRVTGPEEGVTLADGAGRAIPLKQLGYRHF
ncbi:MAG: thiamine-phosphate kinase [Alphaproteobacteria bacterium HGW-Alphaproteobacteria-3]|nr:MAG: thiamine-phosphate kinase [Alphaproteobacteria bacterium HGW-Alphaproteobacteria-3]